MMSPIYGQYAFLVCAHSGELLPEFLDGNSIILRTLIAKADKEKQKGIPFERLSKRDRLIYASINNLEELKEIVEFHNEISTMIEILKTRLTVNFSVIEYPEYGIEIH